MENIKGIIGWAFENGPQALVALHGVLTALIIFFALIPGEQPEKAFHKLADILAKFSRK